MRCFKKLLASVLCLCILTGCTCKHQWKAATCEEAAVCTLCDLVEGEALGHQASDAECVYDFAVPSKEVITRCARCAAVMTSETTTLTSLHDGILFLFDIDGFLQRCQAVASELDYVVVAEETGAFHERILHLYPAGTDGTSSGESLGSCHLYFCNEIFPDRKDGTFHIVFAELDENTALPNALVNALFFMLACDPTMMVDILSFKDGTNLTESELVSTVLMLLQGEPVLRNGLRYTFDRETGYFIFDISG